MVDIIIFFLLQNILLISLLFWLLSFIGTKFFKKKNYTSSDEFFECGFLTTNKFNLTLNFNAYVICLLLILYDVELLFIVPYLFNIQYSTFTTIIVFLFFCFFVVFSLIYD